MTTTAVSFHSDTRNAFFNTCKPTGGINVKLVIQKVGKDPEQNLVGCFDKF